MNKAGPLCNTPAGQGAEKTGVFGSRNKIFNLLLPIFLAVAPAGCAAQKGAARAPSSHSAQEPSEDKNKNNSSGANMDTGNKKDGKGSTTKKSDNDKKNEEWLKEIKRLLYDKEYYEKCYYNWECDTV